MKSFKQFLIENIQEPFNSKPKIGWWKEKDYLDLYHGTHERHLKSIISNGINVKDPKTGMISMTLDPHTAHGYASMSGENNFRKNKAKIIPHEERVVFHFKVPKNWIEQNIDPRLGGNLGKMKDKMENKQEYDNWAKKQGADRDAEYYGMSELRFSNPIPPEFFVGYSRKVAK